MAATSRTTSRSPAPHGPRPRGMTGVTAPSRFPLRGPVGRHLTKAKRSPPEWHDSAGMVVTTRLGKYRTIA
jgi:hypothetical protein